MKVGNTVSGGGPSRPVVGRVTCSAPAPGRGVRCCDEPAQSNQTAITRPAHMCTHKENKALVSAAKQGLDCDLGYQGTCGPRGKRRTMCGSGRQRAALALHAMQTQMRRVHTPCTPCTIHDAPYPNVHGIRAEQGSMASDTALARFCYYSIPDESRPRWGFHPC